MRAGSIGRVKNYSRWYMKKVKDVSCLFYGRESKVGRYSVPTSASKSLIYQHSAVTPSHYPSVNQIDPFSRPVDHSDIPFSQAKSTMQPCGDFSRESQPSQAPLPGFSAEQTSSIYQVFQAVFDQRVGPLQQPVQQSNPTPLLLPLRLRSQIR